MPAKFNSRFLRGRGRGMAVLRTACVSVAARGFSIVASLVTVPIVLHHVGAERYGVWMAAIALSTWFTLADGGITKGLIAQVSRAHGSEDRPRIQSLISSALAVTVAFVFVFFLAVLIGVHLVDWTWAFNLSHPALGREAGSVVTIICASYALAFPATVVRDARLGMLQGGVVNAWELSGSILGFAGLVAAVHLGYGLVVIAAVWVAGPVLMRTISAILFHATDGRDLTPSWSKVRLTACRSLLSAGGVYMIYTLAYALAVQSDQVLIARFMDAEAVTNYSIVQRLFTQPQILTAIVLTAQWPAYGEALGQGDFSWIQHHFRKTLAGFTLIGILSSLALVALCQPILRLWVGDAITAPTQLVYAMGVYGVVAILANAFIFFFLSLELFRQLVFTQFALIAIKLPLTIYLLPQIGSSGAIIGTTAGYLFASVVPGFLMLRYVLLNLSSLRARAPKGQGVGDNVISATPRTTGSMKQPMESRSHCHHRAAEARARGGRT